MQTALEARQGFDERQAPISSQQSGLAGKRVLVVICAHNEVESLPYLLGQLDQVEVLVVDDGSTDGTGQAAELAGARVLKHSVRMGKSASLAEATGYATARGYDTVVEIGADAVPTEGALDVLVRIVGKKGVGGASLLQIPVGPPDVAFYIDEVLWAVLANGKRLQMARGRDSHIGGVMYAFRPASVSALRGSVNDDEQIGASLRLRGLRTVFTDSAQVYFDASSSVGHLLQRRRRMYFGHMLYEKSAAPSMQVGVAACALFKSLLEKPSRLPWAIPAFALDLLGRLAAWRDIRTPGARSAYARWVTTYAKNTRLLARGRSGR